MVHCFALVLVNADYGYLRRPLTEIKAAIDKGQETADFHMTSRNENQGHNTALLSICFARLLFSIVAQGEC